MRQTCSNKFGDPSTIKQPNELLTDRQRPRVSLVFLTPDLSMCKIVPMSFFSLIWYRHGQWKRACSRRVGWGVTSYLWKSTDVRAEWPPFSALPVIWSAPFFQQKVYEWPDFSGFLCKRTIFFLTSWYMHICFAQRFILLVLHELTVIFCLTTSKKSEYKKSKGSIWIGQHFGW